MNVKKVVMELCKLQNKIAVLKDQETELKAELLLEMKSTKQDRLDVKEIVVSLKTKKTFSFDIPKLISKLKPKEIAEMVSIKAAEFTKALEKHPEIARLRKLVSSKDSIAIRQNK